MIARTESWSNSGITFTELLPSHSFFTHISVKNDVHCGEEKLYTLKNLNMFFRNITSLQTIVFGGSSLFPERSKDIEVKENRNLLIKNKVVSSGPKTLYYTNWDIFLCFVFGVTCHLSQINKICILPHVS